jgi:hypothetical protein
VQTSRTRRSAQVGAWLLLVAVVGGGVALLPDLALFWALVAVVPFALIGVCRWLPGPRAVVVAGMVLGGILIPVFACSASTGCGPAWVATAWAPSPA